MKIIRGLCGCRIVYPQQARASAATRRHYRQQPVCGKKAEAEYQRLMVLWGRRDPCEMTGQGLD